jgi:hypothetical protein
MKHLRKFNESSVEDIKSNLEDILSDFSDNYIPVEVRNLREITILPRYQHGRRSLFSITLGDEYADLDMISIVPKDNKDEFLRLYDYMESEGYDFSSMSYDFAGDIVILKIEQIGLGIDSFTNQLFNGIDETCYLKLFFRKK